METITIDEPITVGVVFKKSEVIPKWFIWQNRKYEIKKIELSWKTKEYPEKKIFFACSVSNESIFEISFNLKTLLWVLEKSTTN